MLLMKYHEQYANNPIPRWARTRTPAANEIPATMNEEKPVEQHIDF